MGIDAEIMIRLRGEKPTDKQLTTWSWSICEAIGAEKFFIKDGLPSAEYTKFYRAWKNAFDAHVLHPEYVADHQRGGEAWHDISDQIRADIGPVPEERRRAIDLSCCSSYGLEDDDGEIVEAGKVWHQDGPDIEAEDGEWLLRVSLWTRYYGVGYERGDLLSICAICEWIEANIPNCEVWYGGDSSGVLMEPFDATARYKLRQHLYSQKDDA